MRCAESTTQALVAAAYGEMQGDADQYYLLLFGARFGKRRARSRFVFHHPRQQTFAEAAAESKRVVAPPWIVAERYQGPLRRRGIAFR